MRSTGNRNFPEYRGSSAIKESVRRQRLCMRPDFPGFSEYTEKQQVEQENGCQQKEASDPAGEKYHHCNNIVIVVVLREDIPEGDSFFCFIYDSGRKALTVQLLIFFPKLLFFLGCLAVIDCNGNISRFSGCKIPGACPIIH